MPACQVTDLGASVEKLNKDKVALENSMEMEEVRVVVESRGGPFGGRRGCRGGNLLTLDSIAACVPAR